MAQHLTADRLSNLTGCRHSLSYILFSIVLLELKRLFCFRRFFDLLRASPGKSRLQRFPNAKVVPKHLFFKKELFIQAKRVLPSTGSFKKMTYSKRSVLSCSTIKPTDHDVAKHQQKRQRASRGLSGGSLFLGLKDPPLCIHVISSIFQPDVRRPNYF